MTDIIVTYLDSIIYYLFTDLPIFLCQQCWVPFDQLNLTSVSLIYCLHLLSDLLSSLSSIYETI